MAIANSSWYNDFIPLLKNMTGDNATCDDASTICSVPGQCAQFDDQFKDYQFKIIFETNINYLRVPLSTFTVDSTNS